MSAAFPVKGAAELDRYLSALPKNLQTNAYSQGLRAAAKPVRDEARALARKKSGKMAKAVKTGSVHKNADGTLSVSIRLEGEHAFVGYLEEYGVAPHFISAGDSGMSPRLLTRAGKSGIDIVARKSEHHAEVLKIGDNYISGTVHHPGHAAHPFMRPALDVKSGEAVKAFAAKIREYLEGKTGFIAPAAEEAE